MPKCYITPTHITVVHMPKCYITQSNITRGNILLSVILLIEILAIFQQL